MTTLDSDALANKLRDGAERAKSAALAAISSLVQTADQLEMRETAARLKATEAQLRSDTFNLIVMGRFKNGKSTLLNALMGGTTRNVELDGHKGPMVVNDLPATATLTAVRYADEPYVTAWTFDGKSEKWSMRRYLRESTLDIDDEENQKRFGQIREFEMGFPAKLCQAGVTVFDSPGLDEAETRTLVTRDATKRCDAAIVVYRSDVLMGYGELMDAAKLVADGTRIFTVVNLWAGRTVDDRLRGFVWNKYVHGQLDGPKWNHQDLTSRDIYFVHAELARDARYSGDTARFAESGLADFEARLGEFLLRDRQHVHLSKFTQQASNLAEAVEKQIAQRRLAAQADQQKLREAYAAALPKLTSIRTRPAKIPKIVDRYRGEAEIVLQASLRQAVTRIRQELPEHLETAQLPHGEKFLKVFHEKTLRTEAAEAISKFVIAGLDRWSETEAPSQLEPIMERLEAEIASEVAEIDREFDAINFELTGWTVDTQVSGSVVGAAERILSAVAGFVAGDFVGAFTGGAGGVRGAAGSFVGAFGTSFLLGALGVTALPVLIPAALAGAFILGTFGGGHGFEDRVKKKALEQSDDMIRNMPEKIGPKITGKLMDMFTVLEDTVVQEISAVIDSEEHNIKEMVELNQRDQADRDQILAQLTDTGAAVAKHRLALQQAITIAQQV
jgi:hypothetical protein